MADFHRTLLKGGAFSFIRPQLKCRRNLRLLYEANPVALLAEQAGGVALDGAKRIMDIEPTSIHASITPLVVGSTGS